MSDYKQLEQKIRELQQEVERLKAQETQDKLPDGFNVNAVLEFLKNPKENYGRLNSCFRWSSSPQGVRYWNKLHDGDNQLTDKDIIQLQKWVILYYQQN